MAPRHSDHLPCHYGRIPPLPSAASASADYCSSFSHEVRGLFSQKTFPTNITLCFKSPKSKVRLGDRDETNYICTTTLLQHGAPQR